MMKNKQLSQLFCVGKTLLLTILFMFLIAPVSVMAEEAGQGEKSQIVYHEKYTYQLQVKDGMLVLGAKQHGGKWDYSNIVLKSLGINKLIGKVFLQISDRQMVAIIELKKNEGYEYECLTFTNTVRDGTGKINSELYESAVICKSSERYRVLAVNCGLDGDTLTVLFGQLKIHKGVLQIGKGIVFIHPCPIPAIEGFSKRFQ